MKRLTFSSFAFILLAFLGCNKAPQYNRVIHASGSVGLWLNDPVINIPPDYEEFKIPLSNYLLESAGVELGFRYVSSNDQPAGNDTIKDLILSTSLGPVTGGGKLDLNRCIIAKKDGKWGLINYDNNVIVPFAYDSINVSYEAKFDSLNHKLPYLFLFKGSGVEQVDQQGKVRIPVALELQSGQDLTLQQKMNLIGFSLIGDYLIISKKATYVEKISYDTTSFDALIDPNGDATDPGNHRTEKTVNEKICRFLEGGTYNVIDLKTMTPLFKDWSAKITCEYTGRSSENDLPGLKHTILFDNCQSLENVYYLQDDPTIEFRFVQVN